MLFRCSFSAESGASCASVLRFAMIWTWFARANVRLTWCCKKAHLLQNPVPHVLPYSDLHTRVWVYGALCILQKINRP